MSFESEESVCAELYLYIKHTGKFYAAREMVERALAKKYKAGKFDKKKAPQAFESFVAVGAKEYEREHGSGKFKTPDYFPPVIRRAVQQQFADEFLAEAKLGNFI